MGRSRLRRSGEAAYWLNVAPIRAPASSAVNDELQEAPIRIPKIDACPGSPRATAFDGAELDLDAVHLKMR